MGGFTDGAFSALGAQNQTIAASGNNLFGSVSNAGKTGAVIAVDVTYNASATQGAQIQIERKADTSAFESQESSWVIPIPFTAGTTRTKTVFCPAPDFGEFQVRVLNNDTGQSLTAVNCRVSQSTYA